MESIWDSSEGIDDARWWWPIKEMANGLYKIPHRRPPVQVAGTYATPTTQGQAQNMGLHYTGSQTVGPRHERVHILSRENVGLENKPNFDTYRFKQFGKKWREVNAKGKPVDPEYTDLLKPTNKIEGWSGLVVEDIDPVMGEVKYRQYTQSPIAQEEEKAFSKWLEEVVPEEAQREFQMRSPFQRKVLRDSFKAEQESKRKNKEAASSMFGTALREAMVGAVEAMPREDWVEFDNKQIDRDPWVVE